MSCCPSCHFFDSTVTMTRKLNNGWIKRWRRCEHDNCATKWHTYEMPTASIETDASSDDLKEIKPCPPNP